MTEPMDYQRALSAIQLSSYTSGHGESDHCIKFKDYDGDKHFETIRSALAHAIDDPTSLLNLNAEQGEKIAKLEAALVKIEGFTLSQFMGPHDMGLECILTARKALAEHRGEPAKQPDTKGINA